ncbi:hypothetical protein BCR34DRAFT_513451 [Clohesyomyces aquaticus]|uniref:Rhodopsin domain-containing protein n=1 Tax=Clohesyomyces aquaticus TaxID=1231657 RepID=A0A1Y1ZNA6_9PLEO|nr:hypothetical protein BCR34DRAFT_513451 [Clohesyomyces aquaticus]
MSRFGAHVSHVYRESHLHLCRHPPSLDPPSNSKSNDCLVFSIFKLFTPFSMPGGIHPPLEVVLSWPAPNYINPETRGKGVLIVACIFGPLSTALLLARLWARIRIQRNTGLDDWLMVLALLPIIGVTVVVCLASEVYGFNRHVWDVDPKLYVAGRKIILTLEVVFCITAGLIKVSILLFYRRISSRTVTPSFRWATRISIAFVIGYSFAFALVPIFGCRPITAYWDQLAVQNLYNPAYKFSCFNEGADTFAAAVISAVQDAVTAALPSFLYWKLHIPVRQKIALFSIFAIGYFVVAIAAVRAYFSWHVFFDTYDVTYVGWDNCLWALLELHMGAMCANAPALKVFFNHFLRIDTLSSRSKRSKGSGVNTGSNKMIGSTTSGGSGRMEKLTFWKSHSKHGYMSEPYTDVSVDMHGGVQTSHARAHSKSITTDSVTFFNSTVDEDIEMGNWEAGREGHLTRDGSVEGSEVQALPPMVSQPTAVALSAATAKSRDQELHLFPGETGKKPAWQSSLVMRYDSYQTIG